VVVLVAGHGAFKGMNFYLAARKALIAIGRCSSPHIMADHGQCALCGAPNSWKHSLLECNMVRCVWALESEEIVEHLSKMQEESSRGWLANMFETMSHADLIRVLVTMWAIWYARRKMKASKMKARASRRSLR